MRISSDRGAKSWTSTKNPGPPEANLLTDKVTVDPRLLSQPLVRKLVKARRSALCAVARARYDWGTALWTMGPCESSYPLHNGMRCSMSSCVYVVLGGRSSGSMSVSSGSTLTNGWPPGSRSGELRAVGRGDGSRRAPPDPSAAGPSSERPKTGGSRCGASGLRVRSTSPATIVQRSGSTGSREGEGSVALGPSRRTTGSPSSGTVTREAERREA